jgi:cellulose synthase/poly-beta-1,6-N-acetylglucosamine synthase-like glycosyltransferase
MSNAIFIIWLIINLLLMLHVLHEAVLVVNALRSRKKTKPEVADVDLPMVTIQLPLYNEKYVIERLLDATRNIEYPAHLLEVQILDDSTDETTETIREYIKKYNCNFDLVRREDRSGFKAGALAYGLEFAKGEFVAIFDADFIPSPKFLLETIPHFQDPKVGVVQTRWLHINEDQSLLTRAQALMLNTHFSVEQLGRHNADGFINFNGTAGVWRKACIADAGGWKADTLTEDLDLSFRAQAKGWRFEYLFDVGSPAELPSTFEAYRTQQFRWSKGAAECVRKNWKLLWSSSVNVSSKVMGSFHLLNSSVYLLVVALLLLSPFVFYVNTESLVTVPFHEFFLPIGPIVSASLFLIFLAGSLIANKNKAKALLWYIPSLFTFFSMTTGISLYMSLGVIEGYRGKRSPFVRTPKFGDRNISKKIKSGYDYKKEDSIKVLEILCWAYGLYWCYVGFQTMNAMIIAYALIILTGFSLSLFFKNRTFQWR